MAFRVGMSIALTALATGLYGCAYRDAAQAFAAAYGRADLQDAADVAGRQRQRGPDQHELVWTLEHAKVLLEGGQIAEARAALADAEAQMDAFDLEPEVLLSAGMTANLWNQLATTYRGRLSDRVLLHTLSAIAALADGDLVEAQVQRRKAFVAQTRAVQRHAEAIAQARSHGRYADVGEILDDPAIARDLERARAAAGPAYAAYANPWTSYLAALLMAAEGDASNARTELGKVAAMVPGNATVQRDLARTAWLDEESAGVVYVMLEGGLGPSRTDRTVPYFTPWGGAGAVSLPVLRFEPERVPSFTATLGDGWISSEPLASLDAIVAADYEAEMPVVTLRAIMSTAVKEGATVTSAQISDDSNQIWIILLGSLWKLASAEADTRGWSSLGKMVHVARLPREPGQDDLTISVTGASATLPLPAARAVLVYARSITGGDLAALAMPLSDEPITPVTRRPGAQEPMP